MKTYEVILIHMKINNCHPLKQGQTYINSYEFIQININSYKSPSGAVAPGGLLFMSIIKS